MQKTLLKVVAGMIGVGLLVVGVVAIALPRLVNSDEFHSTLRAAAEEALGAPVEWERLDVGFLPPRLTIHSPEMIDVEADSGRPSWTAESIDLRLALLPILQQRIEVDSLILNGAEVVVIRTSDGFQFPGVRGVTEGGGAESTGNEGSEGGDETSLGFAIRRFALSKSVLVLRDETLSEPMDWRIENLELEAKGQVDDDLLTIDAKAGVRSGEKNVGRIEVGGNVRLTGVYDLEVQLEEILLAAIEPYFEAGAIGGLLSGRVSLSGNASDLTTLGLDLGVEELALKAAGLDLAGSLQLQGARAIGSPTTFSATLDLDGGKSVVWVGKWTEGDTPDSKIALELGLRVSDGGRLDLEGTTTREGVVDLNAVIESFDLLVLNPFLPDSAMELAGIATGTGRLIGPADSPAFFEMDVRVVSGLLRVPDYVVEGPFVAKLEIRDPVSDRPRGRLDVDLTDARIDYQGKFTKRVGMRAELSTTFAPEPSGGIGFKSRIKLKDLDEILLQGTLDESISLVVTTGSVDLTGWHDVFPSLESYQLDGSLSFDGLGLRWRDGKASQLRGRILLDDVGLVLPDASDRIRVRGQILGEGTRLRTDGLRVLMGGLTLDVTGEVEDPIDAQRFRFAVQSVGESEVNDLISALTTSGETLFGNLRLAGTISGMAGGEGELYPSLQGALNFSVGDNGGGRLRGASILELVLNQIPLLGGAARLAQSFRSGRSVKDYYTDRFEIIEGDFQISDGSIHAKMLRLAYKDYEASLTGPIRLQDFKIDMTGELLLKGDLVALLGGASGGEVGSQNTVRIPLAHVTNTLFDPKVVMTAQAMEVVPKLLLQDTALDTLRTGIGRALGRVLGGDLK